MLHILLLVAAFPFHSQCTTTTTTTPQQGKLWPYEPKVTLEQVGERTEQVCAASPAVPSEIADNGCNCEDIDCVFYYPDEALAAVTTGENMQQFLEYREKDGYGGKALGDLARKCSWRYGKSGDECDKAKRAYFMSFVWPFLAPMIFGALCVLAHWTCCFVGCCRCCRRQVCCTERKHPYSVGNRKTIVTVAAWLVVSGVCSGTAALLHYQNLEVNASVRWFICASFTLTDEAIGGSDNCPSFLGVAAASESVDNLKQALDVDQPMVLAIVKVLKDTQSFKAAYESFLQRIAHFENVLHIQGPGTRIFEHRCVFCGLVVGDANHTTGGYPIQGLLPRLSEEVAVSSANALYTMRSYLETGLTGPNLTELARRVKNTDYGLDIFVRAVTENLVDTFARRKASIEVGEELRRLFTATIAAGAHMGTIIGWLALFITKYRYSNEVKYPSGKVHCCAWCCGFCYTTFAAFLGGSFLLVGVVGAEACSFWRYELITHEGLERFSQEFGLVALEEDNMGSEENMMTAERMAIELAQTCFAANGTGNLLKTLELDEGLRFQEELTKSFFELEYRIAEPPVGPESSNIMLLLQEAASNYGGLFVLDPDPSVEGSLGMLDLNPNVAGQLLGSTLYPDDTKSPDNKATLRGLNTYATLIAGPGKYTFAHGTAGGGVLIMSDQPTDQELETLPVVVRNALMYGRVKESLLTSNDSLRCDLLIEGVDEQKQCSLREFRTFVVEEADRLVQAAADLAAETEAVQTGVLNDLRSVMLPILREVRDLRTLFRCRFLRKRFDDFDSSICSDTGGPDGKPGVAPAILQASAQLITMAAFGFAGIVIQYKVWRHLKDNKVVGMEIDRFEELYGAQQRELAVMEKLREAELEAMDGKGATESKPKLKKQGSQAASEAGSHAGSQM